MGQIVDISERGIQLAVSTERLSIVHSNKQKNYVALQEVDAVLVSEKAVNFTGAVLSELATRRIPMVICDGKYLPAGVLCPIFREGSEHIVAFHHQLTMKKSLKKQIWKQLVLEKIRGQHATLKRNGYASNLLKLAKIIRSGDPDNVEARAAAQYWKTLDVFPNRDYSATNANMLFNYVYAVVYAMVARAICVTGLLPHIGVHHHGKYNSFSLASDLMEPFRPLADQAVLTFLEDFPNWVNLAPESRRELLRRLFAISVNLAGEEQNIQSAVKTTVLSYKKCLKNQDSKLLLLPEDA